MASWKQSLRDGALAGSLASVLSAAALLAAGQRRLRRPAAPVNAISHWAWGDAALHVDRPTVRHTVLGYLIHHAASIFWSTLHVRTWGRPSPQRDVKTVAVQAAATAAVACCVDYKLTPRRFTPGFEHRLTKPQLALVYAMFAVGLALGSRRARGRSAVGLLPNIAPKSRAHRIERRWCGK
jgi:hypothetical protein